MKVFKVFGMGMRLMLSVGVALLIGQSAGYGGEFEAVVPSGAQSRLEITIKNFDFTNEAGSVGGEHILVIPAGMEVHWVNRHVLTTINGDQGLMPHGIQISDESNKVFTASSILTREHDSFNHTFSTNGTFSYGCFIHPFMKGKIVVISMPDGKPK
jgi:plastocyanin